MIGTRLGILATQGGFSNNYSLSFDGTDDRINFSTITYDGAFTFSFWIKPTDLDASINVILGFSDSSNYLWLRALGVLRFSINNTILSFNEVDESKKLVEGIWQHLLITRDTSNNVLAFRNGVPFGSTSLNQSGTLTTNRFAGGGGTWFYGGEMDEVAAWTSDQSANAVKIYNLGEPEDLTTNGLTPPTYWYRFEEGSGTVASNTISDSGVGTIDGAIFNTDVP